MSNISDAIDMLRGVLGEIADDSTKRPGLRRHCGAVTILNFQLLKELP